MKRVVKIAVCLASGLALNAGLCADSVVLPSNPYAPIVAHNIFHLNPPQAADAAADANPPPKITPTGIMTIFGTRQALFTVDGVSKPGQPGKTESYILSQGQRQDDIEVTRIDEKSGVVTFNNHGVVQEIPLIKAPAVATSTMPTPIPVNFSPAARPAVPFGDNNGGGNFGRFGRRAGSNSGDNSSGTDDSSNLQNNPTRGVGFSQQSQQVLTPEAQIIAMEVNRQLTADQVRSGKMPPLPPTSLTPPGSPGYIPPPPPIP